MIRAVLIDWGGTLMESFGYPGPMTSWPKVAMVPGADAALNELHGRYSLAVATNAPDSDARMVREALDLVHIGHYFGHILTTHELGASKPSPEFYERALEIVGVEPGEAVMVGDNYDADIVGASKAGLFTVWYLGRRSRAKDCGGCQSRAIESLTELPLAIGRLST